MPSTVTGTSNAVFEVGNHGEHTDDSSQADGDRRQRAPNDKP